MPGPNGKAGIAYRSNTALDLTGAQRIVFFAKGELGGENLAFVVIGKDKTNGQTSNTLSASPQIFKKLTFAVSQNVTLVNDWKRYQISLNGIDLTGATYSPVWNHSIKRENIKHHLHHLEKPSATR